MRPKTVSSIRGQEPELMWWFEIGSQALGPGLRF